MKIIGGYKTEIDPNNKQISVLFQHAGTARFVWNWALDRIERRISKPNAIQLHKEWNEWKRIHAPWWNSVSKCSPQESLRNLERSFSNFFRRCKEKKSGNYRGKVGFPRFKSKKMGVGSFRLTGVIKVFNDRVQLPRLGIMRLKERGYLPEEVKILSATISERANHWFVSLQVEQEVCDPSPKLVDIIGIDLGIQTFGTCSDGATFKNPKALSKNIKKLRKLSRSLSRKQKGSKNRKKVAKKLAKLYYRISNIRKDAIHKITTYLTKTKSVIGIEDLCVSAMLKTRYLARAISDMGLYEFRRQLEYKGKLYGCQIVIINRFFPSSKICNICGCLNDNLNLSDRLWSCECGAILDRDMNASINIKNNALSILNSRVESVVVTSTKTLNACGDSKSSSSAYDQN